ncbi:protein of unknown function [Rhodovastum atsumiense]|nr:protein of unknown function [Rhodovastum atsumiense]
MAISWLMVGIDPLSHPNPVRDPYASPDAFHRQDPQTVEPTLRVRRCLRPEPPENPGRGTARSCLQTTTSRHAIRGSAEGAEPTGQTPTSQAPHAMHGARDVAAGEERQKTPSLAPHSPRLGA